MAFSPPKLKTYLSYTFHIFGLACIGGAIFLQTLTFTSIIFQGYFKAIESNRVVLLGELGLTVYAAIYFIYIYRNHFKLMQRSKEFGPKEMA
jgi:hypothetical protein